MTTERRLSGDLPTILGDLARGPYPDYIDDVLTTTAQLRQRPAWTFPERWLPMVEIARQPVLAPRLPWRSVAMAMLLMALLLAAVAMFVGSQTRVPAPFGPARNGLVAYEAGGDIFTADPVTGEASPILTGPETDVGPRFSLDGTRIVFERKIDFARGQLYTVRSDGTDLRLLTPEPLTLAPGDYGRAWEKYEFSPDGQAVLVATLADGVPGIAIAQTDGTGVRHLDVGMAASEPSFRPPDGAEILFVGRGSMGRGIFALDPSTADVRTIRILTPGYDLAGANWSPDGSRIAYWSWDPTAFEMTAKTHVVAADGTGDRELPSPAGAVWDAHSTWSNDGTQLFIVRGYTNDYEDVRGVVLPADGSSVGVEVAPSGSVETGCCAAWIWSPDDSKLLGRSRALRGAPVPQVVIDVATREANPALWESASDPTWQRLAP